MKCKYVISKALQKILSHKVRTRKLSLPFLHPFQKLCRFLAVFKRDNAFIAILFKQCKYFGSYIIAKRTDKVQKLFIFKYIVYAKKVKFTTIAINSKGGIDNETIKE